MLSSKTNALLTHTLASFWRKQSCWLPVCGTALPQWYPTGIMTSQIIGNLTICSTVYSANNKEEIKAPNSWSFFFFFFFGGGGGGDSGYEWISITKDQ